MSIATILSTEPNVVLPFSRFKGGGIWVETANGGVALRHKSDTLFGEELPAGE